MNILFKITFLLLFLINSFALFSQYDENDDDLEFKKVKTVKILNDKRKFNIHIEAGYSLSTVFGTQVNYLKDSLELYKNKYNFDSFNVTPNFFPYGKINASFNFSKKISMTVGIKYSRIGWKELAKFNNSTTKYIYYNRYDFDYIAIPIALNYHPNKFLSFNIGHTYSILISSKYHSYEYYKHNGIVRTDKKTQQTFKDLAGFAPSILTSQLFIGSEIGTKRIRFSISALMTGNFIRPKIYYSSFSVEAGILFKILHDY